MREMFWRSPVLNEQVQEIIGAGVGISHPTVVEIVGEADFDFILIDIEHNPMDRSDIQQMVRAADCVGKPVLVRVPNASAHEWIATSLDAGAQGVLVPRIETPAQVADALSQARYPPVGRRGSGPARSAQYGSDVKGDLERANVRNLFSIMLETVEALEDIDAITSVQGLDLVLIGPNDMSIALAAAPGDIPLEEAIERIAASCVRNKVACGIFAMSLDELPKRRQQGMTVFIITSDLFMLANAANRAVQDYRAAV